MTIVGRSVDEFESANFARISRFKENGEWHQASTNHSWELFWSEVTSYDGESVELAKTDEPHEILEDDRGEYIVIEQRHQSVIAPGEYLTRLRPFHETGRTQVKPWMEASDAV